MEYNKYTIQDANLLLLVDNFVEEFASCQLTLLINFFSSYDQVPLDIKSWDLTIFQTLLGLLRQTTLLIGGTNLVA